VVLPLPQLCVCASRVFSQLRRKGLEVWNFFSVWCLDMGLTFASASTEQINAVPFVSEVDMASAAAAAACRC
jgi:hypothetical protein